MKILISGSHGLIGTALIKLLTADGHEIVRLVRHASASASEIEWHPNQGSIDAKRLEGFDAVVHLAGESIASSRWSDAKKRAVLDSRVKGTTLLSQALAQLERPPSVFFSASGIGYYGGNRGDELLTEQSSAGNDFLADVCKQWEAATAPAAEKGIRTVLGRFGIVLDEKGGALSQMLTPFRMGIGGRVGSGKQWMSWIALDDVTGAIRLLLRDSFVNGPVNFVSPFPVTNAEFTKTLGRVLSRPTLFPIPAFALRLGFGEMADALLLSGQRVAPEVLQARGFGFQWPRLELALRRILHKEYA